jgi:hypothetical protein
LNQQISQFNSEHEFDIENKHVCFLAQTLSELALECNNAHQPERACAILENQFHTKRI